MVKALPAPSRRLLLSFLAALCLATPFLALADPPVVSNIRASQRAGTFLVDILYDVSDPDGDSPLRVRFEVSPDSGASWNVPVMTFSGAAGESVLPGSNRAIVWNAGLDWSHNFTAQCRVRVIADDKKLPVAPVGMALISAGPINMGNNYSGVEGSSDELPVHSVQISAFYMDKHEVSYDLWNQVRINSTALGYGYSNNGGRFTTDMHPVHTINWYDAVKWCNARSEAEGLTPVYYTDAGLTTVYRQGEVRPFPKWNANGYRLPTEAEWEKAARGGHDGHHFPWASFGGVYTDHIDATKARYNPPGASTVVGGSYAPNGYGLYDMAGNLWEWCWDWYSSSWYSQGGATTADTKGPTSGSSGVLRGGSWFNASINLRCTVRFNAAFDDEHASFGFRCVRGL